MYDKEKEIMFKKKNCFIHLFFVYRAVRCYCAPKGSVVNFTAYQNFIELQSNLP